ncbi:cytochrome C biogenesis protein [Seonamhaeicola marinus]|uniref:Cytochrome C biogenesis protein n=2 Tax=Seonamhaeicola marinus TaxID=1912246 RepID=A0A5D0HPM9_9FLAO|nr:cytochrome C biogenesis protein [Seonamhaeicola marinus]
MAIATFVENDYGTAVAWASIYDAWWFEVVMVGLAISFVFNIFKYKLLRKQKWAVLLFHLAFIIIVLGAGITRYTSYGGIIRIREGASSNVIISDTKLLTATISDGTNSKTIHKKLSFSPLQNNEFRVETDFNGKPISIAYHDYIADASPEVVPDSINGKPLLEMVVTSGEGRNTIYLEKGEIERIGTHQHEVGFESNKEGIINIIEEEGTFKIKAPHPVDFFIMSSQQAGKIQQDTLVNINLKTLFRSGDFSFVPTAFYENGTFKLKSSAKTETDNDKTLDDALIVDVKVGEEPLQETNLLYREGFLPIKHVSHFKDNLQIILSYGSGAIEMPFALKLNDFQLERYPGSSSPSAYASEVMILDGDTQIPYRIFMNNVLDHKGFRFFQASYDTDEQGTVLSVNHDSVGTWVTYIGYFLMSLGMFFTFFGKTSRFQIINKKLRKLKTKVVASLVLLLGLGLSTVSHASTNDTIPKVSIEKLVLSQQIDKQQADLFGRLLVQDLDGRIKPINTLASECIRKVSRKAYFKYPIDGKTIKLDVNQVFLGMHKESGIWQRIPVIKADKKKTGELLNTIPIGKNGLYAFVSFLNTDGQYLLSEAVEQANKKKPSERNEFDKEVLKIDERFNILYNLFTGNYLKIFPNKEDANNTWFSYTHTFEDFTEEDGRFAKSILPAYFKDLNLGNYQEAFNKVNYIQKYQNVIALDIIPNPQRIEAELWYNKANINFWLFQVFFTVGFVLLIMAIIKMFASNKLIDIVWNGLVLLTLIAFLLFTFNIILRWYVSQHAPWSNGYEMLIFVAWCLLLCGILIFRKSDFALPLATLFSGALLFVSYLDWLNPEITNLMPVLKSYWLKIHVATIVSSYAPLALSAVLGIMALLLMLFKTAKTKAIIELKIKELTYINELSMTIGLFTLSIGTFLGGVWANESWGRYWAWDPKETWALISIIVYAIVLHLRFVPKLNNFYTLNVASMFAFWSIIMTSFGVNYYLSGLHSYASGDPVPVPKFVYVVFFSMILISILVAFKRKKSVLKT